MSVNNQIYDLQAAGWWDENHFLHTLKTGLNPARFGYFRQILARRNLDPRQLRVLEIGCGGGLLSEEFARLGCQVTGIDPSAASIETARAHAERNGLLITYSVENGEKLSFTDASFDAVLCCDVLEHVADMKKVIHEAARVLRRPDPGSEKPGGFFFYDTINRTLRSFFETIFIAQFFPLTSFFAPGTHSWQLFVKPAELLAIFAQTGLENQETVGLNPGIPALLTALHLIQRKLGLINYAELGRRLRFKTGGGTDGSYVGYAIRGGT